MYGKVILVCLAVFLVLELLGMLLTRREEEENCIAWNFVAGLLISFAIFEVLVIPCIFTYQKFHVFAGIYTVVLLGLCIVSLSLNHEKIRGFFKGLRKDSIKKPIIFYAAVLLILLEMFMYVQYAHIDDDDAFYVATAVTTLEEDTMYTVNPYTGEAYSSFPARYVLSPFPVYNAFMSKMTGMHPTVCAHNVLPVIFVLSAFFVSYLIGMKLFKQDMKKTGYFLVFCSLIQMYSAYTTHPQGMVYLVRLWQGKAVLASVLLPACFYMAMRLFWNKGKHCDWLICLLLMISCCMVSSMGIMLGAISMGLFGILYGIYHKSVKELVFTALCCIPNVVLAGIYLLM